VYSSPRLLEQRNVVRLSDQRKLKDVGQQQNRVESVKVRRRLSYNPQRDQIMVVKLVKEMRS